LAHLINNSRIQLRQFSKSSNNPRPIEGIKLERVSDDDEMGLEEIQILPHFCDICEKGFPLKIGLENHRKQHFEKRWNNRSQQGESFSMDQTRHSATEIEEIVATAIPHRDETLSSNHNLGEQGHPTSSFQIRNDVEIEESVDLIKSELENTSTISA
jgi:hypothetical protein